MVTVASPGSVGHGWGAAELMKMPRLGHLDTGLVN